MTHRGTENECPNRRCETEGSGYASDGWLIGGLVHGSRHASHHNEDHLAAEHSVVATGYVGKVHFEKIPNAGNYGQPERWPCHAAKPSRHQLRSVASEFAKDRE
jgi:hypothetical protein